MCLDPRQTDSRHSVPIDWVVKHADIACFVCLDPGQTDSVPIDWVVKHADIDLVLCV